MPYKVYKNGDEWCVYKVVGDGQEQIGCHDTENKAQAQLTALNIAEYGGRADGDDLAVHIINDIEGIIEGYVAIWGSPDETDAYNTWFDKANPPDMDLDLLPIALRYEHGMDTEVGKERIGEITDIWFDEIGIAFRGQLDKADKYFSRIISEIKYGTANGKLCTSSGSQDYLTEFRENGSFEVWPLSELSLTAYPAEKRMPQVELIRSEHDQLAVGVVTGNSFADDRHQTDNPNENDITAGNNVAVNEGEIRMLEQLKELLAQYPIDQVIAAILEAGISLEDLKAAMAMLENPEGTPENEETPRSDAADNIDLIAAMGKIIAAKEAQQADTANRSLLAENLKLKAQLVLQTANAQRTAAPANHPAPRGDSTANRGNITGMNDVKYAHLNSRQMAYGYTLMTSRNVPISDDYKRNMAGKTIDLVERGPSVFKDMSNYQNVRSLIGNAKRADEIMYTTNTGYGAEWIPQMWETQVWEAIRQSTLMDTLMQQMMVLEADNRPGSVVYVPTEGADPTFYKAAESTDVGSDLRPGVLVNPSKIATAQVPVTPKKGMSYTQISNELLEDSIVPMLAQYDRQFNQAFTEQIEYLFLNGDTETALNANINLIDGTPATGTGAPSYLITDGVLKYALVTGTGTSVSGGTLTAGDFLTARGKLPNNIITDPDKMVYISDNSTQMKALALTNWTDISVSRAPTQETGTITQAYGSPYFASGRMGKANTAGKISATAGNNVKGRLTCVVPMYWAMVWKRKIQVETFRQPLEDATAIVASFRVAFQARGAGASTCVYNLTV